MGEDVWNPNSEVLKLLKEGVEERGGGLAILVGSNFTSVVLFGLYKYIN